MTYENNVVRMRPPLYEAKSFAAQTELGVFGASGTLCGAVDFFGPFAGTYTLTPDEVQSLILMLTQAQHDVLQNSNPNSDPRIVEHTDYEQETKQ